MQCHLATFIVSLSGSFYIFKLISGFLSRGIFIIICNVMLPGPSFLLFLLLFLNSILLFFSLFKDLKLTVPSSSCYIPFYDASPSPILLRYALSCCHWLKIFSHLPSFFYLAQSVLFLHLSPGEWWYLGCPNELWSPAFRKLYVKYDKNYKFLFYFNIFGTNVWKL